MAEYYSKESKAKAKAAEMARAKAAAAASAARARVGASPAVVRGSGNGGVTPGADWGSPIPR